MFYSPSKKSFYDIKIHGPLIPEDVIEISKAEHQALLNGQAEGKLITADQNGRPVLSDPELLAIDLRRESAKDSIDRAAGLARCRFVSEGDLVVDEYLQAETAVRDWRAAGSPADNVPADIQAWADAAGMTTEQAATDIEQTSNAWRQTLSEIRRIRLQGKSAVDAATDLGTADDMATVAQDYIDQLDAMTPTT